MKIKNKNILLGSILAIIIFNFLCFGFYHLGKFETVDEHFWRYERIPRYWQGLLAGDFKKTYINDKPGVTVALISGIGLLAEPNPENHRLRDSEITEDENYTVYNSFRTEPINIALRSPILLFNAFFLLYFFWILRKLTKNDYIALFTVLFMGISPVLIGVSQIMNPDSFLWTFSAASLFSYLTLLKRKEKKFLFLTAIFTGLSLLSKYTANILFPLYLFLLVTNYLFNKKEIEEKESAKKYFQREIINFLAIMAGAFLVFATFLPASFVKWKYFYRGTIGFPGLKILLLPMTSIILLIGIDIYFWKNKLLSLISSFYTRYHQKILKFFALIMLGSFLLIFINSWTNQEWIPFQDLQKESYMNKDTALGDLLKNEPSVVRFIKLFLLQIYPLVFSLSPIIIFILLAYWIKLLIKGNPNFPLYVLFLTIFPILYLSSLIILDVLTNIRYSIMVYPLYYFLAALGLNEIINSSLVRKYKHAPILLIIFIFISGIYSLQQIKPFYFNYTTDLLPKKFTITDAWGYGEYEAAQYLNSLPNAEKLRIWSDRSAICQFIRGKCIRDYRIDLTKTKPDYFVISRRGEIRHKFLWEYPELAKLSVPEYYKKLESDYVWSLHIDGRPENFVKIIKSEE